MSVITAALGIYGALHLKRAGVLVAKTYDQSLMSINYARAAAADFAAMQAAFARRWASTDPAAQTKLDQTIQALEQTLKDDLTIAAERSQSTRAARAAEDVRRAVEDWSIRRRQLPPHSQPAQAWQLLDHYATIVSQQIDLFVNYTAGDGFAYRETALGAVTIATRLDLAATFGALLLSALVAWLLSRHITGALADASSVAKAIAGGNLDGTVPVGGADELGALLAAMRVMRDNIRAMMEREVAQRRIAQIRLADALESSREGIIVVDANQRVALANSQARDFFGQSVAPQEANQPFILTAAAMAEASHAMTVPLSPAGQVPTTGETQLPDGRWLRVSRSNTQDGGFIVVYSDISVLKNQEAMLKSANLLLDAALDNMCQGLCLYDAEQRLQVVNRRFCEIFGLSPDKVKPGVALREVLQFSVAAGNHMGKSASELLAEELVSINRRAPNLRFQELSRDRVVEIASQPLPVGGWVATYEDVTERRRAEEKIAFMARHDALTGLPNRTLFAERIEQVIAQYERTQQGFAVFILDLDHFKQINDTLGHPVGDELLRSVALRLRSSIRETDTVGRLGGDEFAILQCDLERPEDAAILAQRIVEILNAPYMIEGQRVAISVSIGIALAPGDSVTYDKLLKNADVALYLAKADGRSTWRFFEPEMDMRLQMRRVLELDLRDALVNNEFEVYYQPLFDLADNRISGFEALVRWHHPTRGLVPPMEFIPLAEEIGLIVPLGEWVMRRACAQAMEWPDHVKVAVNVSAVQFRNDHLKQAVADALRTSGLAASRLELEITESVLLTNNAATLATLHELRDFGVSISMDDFGTGYSSLSYLRSFPFDKIKIDQSFVRSRSERDGSAAIVQAIAALGGSLGIKTLAEGVETKEQLDRLRAIGCDEAQGYYFSPPVPAKEAQALLARWNAPPVRRRMRSVPTHH